MIRLRLENLTLTHFKGVSSSKICLKGKNANLYGENASGKTTHKDAFSWLLFDKDSNNRKDFQLKTVDENNKEIPNLSHEVEGEFSLDGQRITLKKAFYEKWTRKRGEAHASFSGHKTDHYIDDVPVSKTDFNSKVQQMIGGAETDKKKSENVFKLLTSPDYFSEVMNWKDRRDILLDIGGGVTDEEVFKAYPKLADLHKKLDGRSVEDFLKMIAAQKKKINDELSRLPVRIDEQSRSLPDTSGLNEEQLQQEHEEKKAAISEKREQEHSIKNGGLASEKKKEIAEIDGQILEIKNKHQGQQYNDINEKRKALTGTERELELKRRQKNQASSDAVQHVESAELLEKEAEELREQYAEEKEKEHTAHQADTCPTCKQNLPADQIEAAHKEALSAFNDKKAEALERIAGYGKETMNQAKALRESAAERKKKAETVEKEVEKLEKEVEAQSNEIQELEKNVSDVSKNEEYQDAVKKRESIQEEIKNLQDTEREQLQKIQSEIQELETEKAFTERQLATLTQKEQGERRIAELEAEEKKLAAEFEAIEKQIFQGEAFIKNRVEMIESRINDKFRFARFKLFHVNINGGVEETCETLFEGVPFSAGLNKAAQINVGLDIINTLSEYYGFQAPIFIDNREAVTNLIDIEAQIINLIVDKEVYGLIVEVQEKEAV